MKTRFRSLTVLACTLCALLAVTAQAHAVPPINDNITDAVTLTPGVPETVDATDADPELEVDEPGPANPNFGKTVWFKWTSPGYGEFTFDSCGSEFDTITSAYSDIYGNGLELYDPSARVDSSCPGSGGDALPTFAVGPGEVLFFQVGAYNKLSPTGNVTANLHFNPQPANDAFANSVEITDGDTLPGTNVASTTELNEPTSPYSPLRTVWYHFDAPSNGEVTFDTCDADFDSVVIAFKGSAVDSLVPAGASYYADQGCLAGSGSKLSDLRVRTGERIYFRVQSYPPTPPGHFTASLNFDAAPSNDDFADASAISGNSGSAPFNNAFSSMQDNEPNTGGRDRSVWFTYTPTASGWATFNTCDASGDTVIDVYTGNDLATLVNVTYVDGNCPGGGLGDHSYPIAVTANTAYHVRVSNYYGSGSLSGNLGVDLEEVPANDNWADARDLGSDANVSITDDNRYATTEVDEPQIYGSVRPLSVWYKWTAPYDGMASFGSCGVATASHDGVLAVFTGSTLSTLSQLAEADDGCGGSASGMGRLTLGVTQGTVYWIAVANWSVTTYGIDFGVEVGMLPENTSLPSFSGSDYFVGTELTASPGTWSGVTPITYEYVWLRCDVGGGNCAAISGATSSTYTLTDDDYEHTVRVRVTATNALSSGAANSVESVLIDRDTDGDNVGDADDACPTVSAAGSGKANGCPAESVEITSNSSIDGDPAIDSGELALSYGLAVNDPGIDPDVLAPEQSTVGWYRCSSPSDAGDCTLLASNVETYVPVDDDLASYIRVKVVWTNDDGASADDWSNAVAIHKISPSMPSFSGTLQVGQTLTGDPGSAVNQPAGGTAPSVLATQWWFCTSAVDDECEMGPAGSTLVIPASAVGKFIRFGVVWFNGISSRAQDSSADGPVTPLPVVPDPDPVIPDPLNLAALKLPKKASAKKLVKAKGRFTIKAIQFACPAGGTACKISLSYTTKVKKKTKKLGSSTLSVPAGGSLPLSGKLSSAGLKQLKKSKKLKVAIAIKGSGGASGKATFKEFTITK